MYLKSVNSLDVEIYDYKDIIEKYKIDIMFSAEDLEYEDLDESYGIYEWNEFKQTLAGIIYLYKANINKNITSDLLFGWIFSEYCLCMHELHDRDKLFKVCDKMTEEINKLK